MVSDPGTDEETAQSGAKPKQSEEDSHTEEKSRWLSQSPPGCGGQVTMKWEFASMQ